MTINFNSDVLALYQTFYTAKKIDLTESLAWLIADEKSFGASEEQGNLIVHLANFYFDAIEAIRKVNDPAWTHLSYLTQAEYDKIMYNREVLEY